MKICGKKIIDTNTIDNISFGLRIMSRIITLFFFVIFSASFHTTPLIYGFDETSPNVPRDDLAAIQEQLLQAADKTLPSVVGLRVNRSVIGSGVVVSEDGLVLTAAHVTSNAGLDVEFLFPDGRRARGKTLGVCKWADAAMAKITDSGPWPYSPMAAQNTFAVDDWVFAYGHSLGLIVNRPPPLRLGRILQLQPDTVHSDCSIVVGDSGGPLFNLAGEVVGINSRISGIDDRPDLTYHVSINAFWEQYDRLIAGEVWENDSKGRYDEPLNKQLQTATESILPLTVRVQSPMPQNRTRGGNQRQRRSSQQRSSQYVNLALGMIVNANGLVVTKASEVAARRDLSCVIRSNGREERYAAQVVAVDRRNDIALLKIENFGLSTAGKDWLDRFWAEESPETETNTNVVAVDLPIGTIVVTPVPEGNIPAILGAVSVSKRSIPSENLSIGVSIDGNSSGDGARILQTLPRSSAAAGGLRQDDVITKINETDIENHATLAEFFEKVNPGDQLKLTVLRGSQILSVTLQAMNVSELAERRNAMNQGGPFGISRVHDGFPGVVQHDSILRPTDCGGPIITLEGRLVGVNIARAGRTETYSIPAAKLRQIVKELQPK